MYIYRLPGRAQWEFDTPPASGTRVCLNKIQGVGLGKTIMTGMNFEVKDILLRNWGACLDAIF
jgi:hypothetical protein